MADTQSLDLQQPSTLSEQELMCRQAARVDGIEEVERRRETQQASRVALRDLSINVGFNPLPASLRDNPHGALLLVVTGPGYTRPASPYPGVCLLAYFGDDDAGMVTRLATQYAQQVIVPNFNHCDLRLVPIDKWTLIASNPDRMADEQYCMTFMDNAMEGYYNMLRSNQTHFKQKVEQVTGKRLDAPAPDSQAEAQEPEAKAEPKLSHAELQAKMREKKIKLEAARVPKAVKEHCSGQEQMEVLGLGDRSKQNKVSVRQKLRREQVKERNKDAALMMPFPGHLLRRNQVCAAVCFLNDVRPEARKGKDDKQPMFRVLRVYESRESAEKDVEVNLSKFIADFDIHIVDMAEWLFPEDVDFDKQENFKYRDKEQDRIMQRRLESKREVRDHELLRQEQGAAPTELFLKQAEEGISPDEYYKQTMIEGTVLPPIEINPEDEDDIKSSVPMGAIFSGH